MRKVLTMMAMIATTGCADGTDWVMCWDPMIVPGGVFFEGDGDVGDDLRSQEIPLERVGENSTGMFVIGFPRADVGVPGYTREIMLWRIGDFDDTTTADIFDLVPEDTKTCVECIGESPPGQIVPGDCEVTDEDLDTTWICDIPPFGVPF